MAEDSETEDDREVFAPLRKALDEDDTLRRGDEFWYEESFFKDALRRTSSGEMIRASFISDCPAIVTIDVTKTASLETGEYKMKRDSNGKFSLALGAFVRNGLNGLSTEIDRLRARVVLVSVERVPVIDLAQMSLLHRAYHISLPMLWYYFRITQSWPSHNEHPPRRSSDNTHYQLLFEQVNTAWSSLRLFSLGLHSTLFLTTDKSLNLRTIPTGKSDVYVRLHRLLQLISYLLQSSFSVAGIGRVPIPRTRFPQH